MYMLNSKAKKALSIMGGLALGLIMLVLFVIDAKNTADIKASFERDAADEMAECWADYYNGKNGGECHFEYHYTDGGQTLVGVEVIAAPLE